MYKSGNCISSILFIKKALWLSAFFLTLNNTEMQETKKYNNFSTKLKSFLPKLKPGEKIRWQLESVHVNKETGVLVCPQSYGLLPNDRIFDPWGGDDVGKGNGAQDQNGKPTGYEGVMVDIAYILRESPAPRDSNKESIVNFGSVRFVKVKAGIIEVIGGRREMEKILPLLFFSNHNATNVDKPWFVKPNGKPKFHQIKTSEKAKIELKTEIKRDQARTIVMAMEGEELNRAAAGLFPNIHTSLTDDQKTMKLRAIAAKNPEKILDLSKNVEVRTTAFVEECLKANLIEINKDKGQVVWPDDKTLICTIKAGLTFHNSLKRYFMTDEGVEVLASLEQQLANAKKPKKDKTEKVIA